MHTLAGSSLTIDIARVALYSAIAELQTDYFDYFLETIEPAVVVFKILCLLGVVLTPRLCQKSW